MAEILDNFTPRRGRPQKYPWAEWTDGQARRITRGVDFDTPLASMAALLRTHAVRNELDVTVTTITADDALEFVFSRRRRRRAAA